MITESQVYWITRLDGIHDLFMTLTVFSFVAIGILGLTSVIAYASGINGEEECRRFHWFLRWLIVSIVVAIVSACCAIFIPTTKEMAMIKIIPAISNSKFVAEELPKDAREIYDLAKKEMVRKLSGNEEEKKAQK